MTEPTLVDLKIKIQELEAEEQQWIDDKRKFIKRINKYNEYLGDTIFNIDTLIARLGTFSELHGEEIVPALSDRTIDELTVIKDALGIAQEMHYKHIWDYDDYARGINGQTKQEEEEVKDESKESITTD